MAETPREESPALRCSVLVVAHNCAGPLGRALAALERSSPRAAIEIIVVDNGSRDGSGQLDAEFPAASFLRLPKNFGYTKAANIGIRGAKGDYVLLLPAHVEVAPDSIARLVARLDNDPEAGAVCPVPADAYPLPAPEQLYAEWKGASLPAHAIGDEEMAVGYVRDTPILVRRSFLAGMRFLDERFGDFGAQLDLCRQLRNAGKRLLVLPSVNVGGEKPEPVPMGGVERADWLNGVAAYAGKYFGFGPSFQIRAGASFKSLVSLRLQELGGLLSAQKIDGEQPDA